MLMTDVLLCCPYSWCLTRSSHTLTRLLFVHRLFSTQAATETVTAPDGTPQLIKSLPAGAAPMVRQDKSSLCLATSNQGVYSNPLAGLSTSRVALPPGDYVVVPSSFEPIEAVFCLKFFCTPGPTTPIARIM
jgi:hypothetical protein